MELSHQLKMWPSQAGKSATRSSGALIVVRLQVLDGQSDARTSRLAASKALWTFSHSLINPLFAELAPGFLPAQSGPCGVGLILSLPFFSHTQSLPTVLRFTANGHKED